ncbi:MAG: tetratricopeptide repeat protein, partial [Armatimonadota bacterium]
ALRCMDDDPGSLAELRHAADLYPNDPEVLWRLEIAIDNAGGSDAERIRLLERSLELAPRRMRTLSSLSYTHYLLDQHDLALQTFERMKRVNPACEGAYTGAGLVYAYGLHDMERSLQQYGIAIALKPTDDEVWRGKMHAIRHFGDPADALKTIDEAIAAGIPESRWLHDRGMIYLSMGRYDDAVAEYTRALELGIEATRRQDLMLYWLRARAQMYAERYEEAWADLHRGQDAGMNDDMFEALAEELREHMPEPERESEG